MTTREIAIGALGFVAGAALVGAGVLLWSLATDSGDEGGIRVKNGGSVYIETISTLGFDFNMAATEFRTRRDTKGCYDLKVVAGSSDCAGKVLYQVTSVTLVTSDRAAHGIGLHGKKVAVKRGRGWSPKGQGSLDLKYGTQAIDLARVVATGYDTAGNDESVQCTFEGPTREFELTSVDCN